MIYLFVALSVIALLIMLMHSLSMKKLVRMQNMFLSNLSHCVEELMEEYYEFFNAKISGFPFGRDDKKRIVRAGAGALIRTMVKDHGRRLRLHRSGGQSEITVGKGILFDTPIIVPDGYGNTIFVHGVMATGKTLREKEISSVFFNSGEVCDLAAICGGPQLEMSGGVAYTSGLDIRDFPMLSDDTMLRILDRCAEKTNAVKKD